MNRRPGESRGVMPLEAPAFAGATDENDSPRKRATLAGRP